MAKQPPSRRPVAPPPPPAPKKSNSRVIVLAVVLMLAAFGCGFGALWVQAGLSQPLASNCGSATQPFVVATGDGESTVVSNLEKQHFIRNANILKLYLKFRNKTITAAPATYQLSPCWNLQQIIGVLNAPPSTGYVSFTVPEGERLTQYPDAILGSAVVHDPGQPDDKLTGQKALPNFSTQDFLNITVKGTTFPNESAYWWIKPWNSPKSTGALTALEGYLFPSQYQAFPNDDTITIIKRMLKGFAELLCPGPDQTNIDQYIFDQTQCIAHQATITVPTGPVVGIPGGKVPGAGTSMGVFAALKKYYEPTDVVKSLAEALTLASLAQREARSPEHHFLVSSVYYNRFKYQGGGTNGNLNADVAYQYWLGGQPNATSPWPTLATLPTGSPDPNPYNLYANAGLSPSAISGVTADALYAGIFPPNTGYYYFYFGCDKNNHYAATYAQQQVNQAKYGAGQC